jgi:hypothetical protein
LVVVAYQKYLHNHREIYLFILSGIQLPQYYCMLNREQNYVGNEHLIL